MVGDMKAKIDFVTNSSSTAFIITNNNNKKDLSLVDFVNENPQLIKEYVKYYGYGDNKDYTQEMLIESAEENNSIIEAGESKYVIFGDEDGTLIGEVFDYILREGGKSKNFTWEFAEYLR